MFVVFYHNGRGGPLVLLCVSREIIIIIVLITVTQSTEREFRDF